MKESSTREMLPFAIETARQAGRLLSDNLHSAFGISKKGRINLVTEMDLRSEELITERINRFFPEHQVLAEERGAGAQSSSEYKWVIDPLDGTTNYAHGYRFFCVSIALELSGEIVLGVVCDPVTDELFSAAKGAGAHLNGAPISVSSAASLQDSMLATGFSYELKATRRNLDFFKRFVLRSRAVRRDGSAALDLCYTACGRFDGFWELSLNPWDVAAGALIVEESGGRVTRFNGSDCTIYDEEILASNGLIHAEMMSVLGVRGGE